MPRPSFHCATFVLAALLFTSAQATSLIETTPAVPSTTTVEPFGADFRFSHHFQVLGPKLLNSPTFMLEVGIIDRLSVTVNYASSSSVGPKVNEVEPRATFTILKADSAALGLAAMAGYNSSAESVDAAVSAERTFGRVTVLASLRGFSQGYATGGLTSAASAGLTVELTRNLHLVGDVGRILWSQHEISPEAPPHWAWSAGLAVQIPYSPHSLSLYATNLNTLTLQGGVLGTDALRIGFQFVIPFRNADRWGEIFVPEPVPAEQPAADVEVVIGDYRYAPSDLSIRAGTTVRFVNRDTVAHTATATSGAWDSGVIAPGGSWVHRFDEPGDHPYFCTLHPNMRATLKVTP